jgi:peptidylprolyl isomerase
MMMVLRRCALLLMVAALAEGFSLSISMCSPTTLDAGGKALCDATPPVSRRSALVVCTAAALLRSSSASAADAKGLVFVTAPSGLQWADAKVGTGKPLKTGSQCTIDYVMSTSGARYGSKIYSTKEVEKPYRWVIGDGKTIQGLELAVTGAEGVSPMLPGGVRRVIIPQSMGYLALAKPLPGMQFQDCQEGRGPGPIPPELTGAGEGAYQRFKNIYCNANRPYQPDLVLDIKLYGKRDAKKEVEADEDEE